jgi:hypothetical protein
MSEIVLDYVSQPADFPTMKARGVGGAVVYVAPAAWGWPKAVTPAQVRAAEAAQFPLAFNFEQNPGDYLGGYTKGLTHGTNIAQALGELGLAPDQSCYLSVDTEVPAQNFPTAGDYFRGAAAAAGKHPLDFYGENLLGEYLVQAGLVSRLWMSESTGFPGNQAPTAHVVLQQRYRWPVSNLPGGYDVNTVLQSDWGQHPRPVSPNPTPPNPQQREIEVPFFFYRVLDDAPHVDPSFVWKSDGFWTKHVSPAELGGLTWIAASQGVTHLEVGSLSGAAHSQLWQHAP